MRCYSGWRCVTPNHHWLLHFRLESANLNNDKIELEPKQYGVVKISNRIKLSDGIVGQFTPSSILIECGLLLTAGKLDQGYEGDIIFGLYNANSVKTVLTGSMKLAYISFYDLRGVSNSVGKYYEEYVREMAKQRALDDYLAKKFNCDFSHARSEF